MIKDVCTIEQMEALKALGVDVSRASACLLTIRNEGKNEVIVSQNHPIYRDATIPVFTINDMWNKLPPRIDEYFLEMKVTPSVNCLCRYANKDYELCRSKENSIKDAIYGMLLYLIEASKLKV